MNLLSQKKMSAQMKNPRVSIVRFLYKPEKEVYERITEMIKKQTIKAEIIENWNMPTAKSLNKGIKEAKGDIIVTLAQDCIPENEFWLEKLIKPLEDNKVAATISDLYLPEKYWKKYPFWTRIFTISDRKDKKNGLDARGCAYRKKDLIEISLFNEDPRVIGIDTELAVKLRVKGEFIRPNVRVLHLHKSESIKEVIKKIYTYSEGNGKIIKKFGLKVGKLDFWIRIIKILPLIGMGLSLFRFPYKKYFYLFPFYLIIAIPTIHAINLIGFWKGFFLNKERIRNFNESKP